jgi:hypothetical protein
VNRLLLDNGIIGGYELEDALLLAFTEKRSRMEIDRLVALIGGVEMNKILFEKNQPGSNGFSLPPLDFPADALSSTIRQRFCVRPSLICRN